LEHKIPQGLFVFIPCGMYTIYFYNNTTSLSHVSPYMKKSPCYANFFLPANVKLVTSTEKQN